MTSYIEGIIGLLKKFRNSDLLNNQSCHGVSIDMHHFY